MSLDSIQRAKIASAVPALAERADGIGAEAADLYEAAVGIREQFLALREEVQELTRLLALAGPLERGQTVAQVATEPSFDFAERAAAVIDRMTADDLREYCARSADVDKDSCRQAVMPKPVKREGHITGHRAHGRFARLQAAVGLDKAPASEWLAAWKWLASKPANVPGDWPTIYAYLRAVPLEAADKYLRDCGL